MQGRVQAHIIISIIKVQVMLPPLENIIKTVAEKVKEQNQYERLTILSKQVNLESIKYKSNHTKHLLATKIFINKQVYHSLRMPISFQ